MAAEPTRPTDETPDRHPDVPDAGPVDDVELPDDDVVAGASDQAEDDEIDEVATEHAMNDELPDGSTPDEVVDDADANYAALSPADEARGATEGDPNAPAGTSQVGTGPGQGDPPEGTEQPVTTEQVEVADALGSEDPADRLVDDDTIDGIDEPAPIDEGDELDEDLDGFTEDDEVEELSADVRAIDDNRTPGAFDDSSSVVESDMTDTGVSDAPSDGGDEHERDDAVHDLPDDADGIESPER